MRKQAQGYLPYILIGLIVVIVFAVIAIPMAFVSDKMLDELKNTTAVAEQPNTVKHINTVQALVTPALDQLIFIILISIIIGCFVIAIFTDFHPVVLGIFILATILLVIIAGIMANVYDEVKNNEVISDKAGEFKFTNIVMGSQFPIIILIVGVISIIIILSKRGGSISV